MSFDLKPGERILEREVSEELGVSRTPLREALSKLEQEGYVRSFPKRGFFVSNISEKEVVELYEVRESLECLAVKQCIAKGTEKDWKRLSSLLIGKTEVTDQIPKKDKRFDAGRAFHLEIARISGNLTLNDMLQSVFEKIDRVRWVDIFFIDRAEVSLTEHTEMLRLLKAGKTKEAQTLTQKHIRRAKQDILRLLERKRDLFYIT